MSENDVQEKSYQTSKGIIGDAISALKEPGEITKDIISAPAQEIGKTLGDLVYVLSLPIKKWRASSDFKLEKHMEELQEKYKNEIIDKISKIPEDKIVEPKLSIVGPALETSKYYIEEKELRDMFTSLIAASANADYQNASLPAFVEIIKQLSPFDVMNILELHKIHTEKPGIAKVSGTLRATESPTSNKGSDWLRDFIPFEGLNFEKRQAYSASLDNLKRLAIIKITPNYNLDDPRFQDQIVEHQIYKDFHEIHKYYLEKTSDYSNPHFKLVRGLWDFTEFGKLFIKCCIES